LMVLGEKAPRPIAQVARSTVINISTMARIVERMTRAGLIDSRPSSEDGRVTEIFLTTTGQEKLAAARAVTAPIYRKLIRGFGAEDFGLLIDMLNRLHDNLD